MGFNWEELLKGLGQPRPDAPKEVVPDSTAPVGPGKRQAKPQVQPQSPLGEPGRRPHDARRTGSPTSKAASAATQTRADCGSSSEASRRSWSRLPAVRSRR